MKCNTRASPLEHEMYFVASMSRLLLELSDAERQALISTSKHLEFTRDRDNIDDETLYKVYHQRLGKIKDMKRNGEWQDNDL
ncbi:MAG: hypothetical protein BZ138_05865 [Methanosphaera sp. rholeuAM270]|nr:MAG: hypothetical protein BZ138_05865 [Methanosphaera sp. rholeuAM270]